MRSSKDTVVEAGEMRRSKDTEQDMKSREHDIKSREQERSERDRS